MEATAASVTYLVADNYIALMSRWTTCGAWEGNVILDFLKENESDVKPIRFMPILKVRALQSSA